MHLWGVGGGLIVSKNCFVLSQFNLESVSIFKVHWYYYCYILQQTLKITSWIHLMVKWITTNFAVCLYGTAITLLYMKYDYPRNEWANKSVKHIIVLPFLHNPRTEWASTSVKHITVLPFLHYPRTEWASKSVKHITVLPFLHYPRTE